MTSWLAHRGRLPGRSCRVVGPSSYGGRLSTGAVFVVREAVGVSDQKELATPERCRAYARLAEEVARSRTVTAEMALFLASGLLGATLPHYFDRNRWWELGAVGAVAGLGAGLRRRFLARDWQRRAAYYHQRASSHDQRPAAGVPATAAGP